MKILLRWIRSGNKSEHGGGRNTFESERQEVLLMGYRTVHWTELNQGEQEQSRGYDRVIETPLGQRYALAVRLEEGEE